MTHVTPQWMIDQGFSETFAERFWKKVQKTESCWIWTASKSRRGYGQISKRRSFPVESHKASWMLHFGPTNGLLVCHNCPGGDNTSCVNPDHLWLGTQKDNMSDASKKGRIKIPHYYGENHPNHKLTSSDVEIIRSEWPRKHLKHLANHFGVSVSTIWNVVHFNTWPSNQVGTPEIRPVGLMVNPGGNDPFDIFHK